ncbi:YhfC family intramembrane metalloprotease [Candidatus Peregrinibacteria bacterium]|nr:YhfC family intramembrane metalloprotease [Candidatus Peregrinibacteria bacterium]
MNVILATAISGLVLTVAPLVLVKTLRFRFKIEQSLFWRAGLWFLLIQMFQVVVLGNLADSFPALRNLPDIVIALVYGLFIGLFVELCRYVLLDKVFKTVRSYKEALYFGVCWTALTTVVVGLVLFLGSFGLNTVANTNDLSTLVGSTTPSDLEQATLFQEQARELLTQPTIYGFLPLLDRGAFLLFDIALSLLIVLGLNKGETGYAWAAVFARSAVSTCFYIVSGMNELIPIVALLVLGILSFVFISRIPSAFPKQRV